MNPRSRWLTIAALFVIFLAGTVTGWLAGLALAQRRHIRPPRREDMATHMRERMMRELSLTAPQADKIEPLIGQSVAELDRIRRETDERVIRIMDEMHGKIAAELTPDQAARLKSMNERRRAMMREGRDGPGPGPGGK